MGTECSHLGRDISSLENRGGSSNGAVSESHHPPGAIFPGAKEKTIFPCIKTTATSARPMNVRVRYANAMTMI